MCNSHWLFKPKRKKQNKKQHKQRNNKKNKVLFVYFALILIKKNHRSVFTACFLRFQQSQEKKKNVRTWYVHIFQLLSIYKYFQERELYIIIWRAAVFIGHSMQTLCLCVFASGRRLNSNHEELAVYFVPSLIKPIV